MTSNGKSIMDIAEELSYRAQGFSTEVFSNTIIKYMFSDELLNAVIKNINLPRYNDIRIRTEKKKLERSSDKSKKKLEQKLRFIKEVQISKGWFNPLVWDGIDQIPNTPARYISSCSARAEDVFISRADSKPGTWFLETDLYNSKVDTAGAINERKNIQDIRETLLMMEERLDRNLNIDLFTARKVLNTFDKFVGIPFYENRLFRLLERDKSHRKDKLSSKFMDLLPREEKPYLNTDKNFASKKRRIMKRLLSEIIVSETIGEISKLQDDYINNKIGYQDYLEGMLEIADYAFDKWE